MDPHAAAEMFLSHEPAAVGGSKVKDVASLRSRLQMCPSVGLCLLLIFVHAQAAAVEMTVCSAVT